MTTMTQQPQPADDAHADRRMLSAGDIEAIADATATKLAQIVRGGPATFGLVDARQLAHELAVSLDYVYAHAAELGGMRLGSGPKARIRFDLDHARQALEAGRGVGNGARTSRRTRSARGR